MKAYTFLTETFKKASLARNISSMLNWDAATQMPQGSAEVRGEQMAFLALYTHDLMQNPLLMENLQKAKDEDLTAHQKANVAEMERMVIHAQALPKDLVEAMTKAQSTTEMIWRDAKKESNFKKLEKPLTEMFAFAREAGEIKAEKLGCSPYEALMDEFDPGTRTAEIDALFGELKPFLLDLLPKAMEKQRKENNAVTIEGFYPAEAQKTFYKKLMTNLGFDFDRGRLDESSHPFCGGVTGDIRLTTWVNEKDFTSPLMAVIHETGHALYEMGLPEDFLHQPGGQARGMAMHESQSLLFEKQVGLHPAFIKGIFPDLSKALNLSLEEADLWKSMTHVKPSFIRVEADEITYPLHVMLRYEIEKGIVEKQYKVADMPGIWAEKMQSALGITPKNDAEGCLQDIHWPSGAIGYFPSYTLGAVMAAQLFEAALKQNEAILHELSLGQTKQLLAWLRRNVHQKASLDTRNAILKEATGSALSLEPFKRHLANRYL